MTLQDFVSLRALRQALAKVRDLGPMIRGNKDLIDLPAESNYWALSPEDREMLEKLFGGSEAKKPELTTIPKVYRNVGE